MLAMVYDGTHVRLYLDGVEAPTSGTASGPVITATGAYILEFGNFPYAEAWEPFHGLIDSVKIYDEALTQEAILDEFVTERLSLLDRGGWALLAALLGLAGSFEVWRRTRLACPDNS